MTSSEADQAGGEVVYASDGLPAAPAAAAVKFPVASFNGTAVLETDSYVSPAAAFEMFAGKLYPAPRGEGGSSNSSNINNSTATATHETPLERLGRLQRELAQLEQDVGSSSAGGTTSAQTEDLTAAAWNQTVRGLQSRLQASSAAMQQQQAHLTAVLQQPVQSASTTTTSTYASATTLAMEERLRRLESAVGGSTSSAATTTWTQRLRNLEELANKLDATALETAVAKAKVIRQDLEAAAKARNKLLARQGGTDAQKIQDLHAALQELQGMTQHLPVLTRRLQVLSQQHTDQATWAMRLQSSEIAVQHLQQTVATLEQSAQQLQGGWQVNATQLQANMNELDARLAK
jgi:hypothetical protein